MSNERVGWEGWALATIAVVGIPVGLLFMPLVGGFGGTSHARYRSIDTPPPPIDGARLTVGLVTALLLVVAAAWLIHRTDWETPDHKDDR